MTSQSWIFGSSKQCDIVVENATVSARHCRLTAVGDTLTIEDVGSTNGTYVNGRKIESPHTVTLADRITLGQSLPLPWPDELRREGLKVTDENKAVAETSSDRITITLGRDANNSVVLAEANVSTHHARLIMANDVITIEDLGSTNGTAIKTIENKIQRAEVEPQDTVFLGSTAYRVADLMARAGSTSPANTPVPENDSATGRAVSLSPLTLATVGAVLFVGLSVWQLWPVGTAPDTVPAMVAQPTPSESLASPATTSVVEAESNRTGDVAGEYATGAKAEAG